MGVCLKASCAGCLARVAYHGFFTAPSTCRGHMGAFGSGVLNEHGNCIAKKHRDCADDIDDHVTTCLGYDYNFACDEDFDLGSLATDTYTEWKKEAESNAKEEVKWPAKAAEKASKATEKARKAMEEVYERRATVEAERKAKVEAERKAKEEAERKTREEEEVRKAKE